MITAANKPRIPEIPNPDGRKWHPLTLAAWENAWRSPMAGEWLATDADAIGRLAMLWDKFYKKPDPNTLKEIRLQSALFGLSPLDRSRLQWEVEKGSAAEERQTKRRQAKQRPFVGDPRKVLRIAK